MSGDRVPPAEETKREAHTATLIAQETIRPLTRLPRSRWPLCRQCFVAVRPVRPDHDTFVRPRRSRPFAHVLSLLKNDASLIRRRDWLARLGVCSGDRVGPPLGRCAGASRSKAAEGGGAARMPKLWIQQGSYQRGDDRRMPCPNEDAVDIPPPGEEWLSASWIVICRRWLCLSASLLAHSTLAPAVRRRMGWPITSHPPSRAYHRPVPAWLRLRNSPPHGQDCPVRTLLLRSPYTGNATRQVQAQSTAGLAGVLGRVVETREGGRRREGLMAALADVSTPTRSRRSRARSMCATTPQAPPNLGRRAHVLCPDVCRDSPSALWPVPVPVPPCLYHVRGALKLRQLYCNSVFYFHAVWPHECSRNTATIYLKINK